MEIGTEEILIEECLHRIEDHLEWGSSEAWTTQDYEKLSKKIFESTGVTLSVATLKRIWGKVKYESKPTITTLNTLAQFIGFESWRAFRQGQLTTQTNGNGHSKNGVQRDETYLLRKQRKKFFWGGAVVLVLGIGALLYFTQSTIKPAPLDSSRFQFSSKKVVDNGVPNTVIFDYDASAASPSDSVFIQQSWDKRLSRQVSRDARQHASIYYYPGFFRAKLVINQQIVKEHDLTITTTGWLPLIEQSKVPVYFKQETTLQNGVMQLPLEMITQSNIALQPVTPWVAYFNMGDFGDLKTDDFIFETEFKNDYSEGSAACQFVEIRIQFEGPAIVLPFSAKGCVSELNMAGDEMTRDLSLFGCDFSEWVSLKCIIKREKGEVLVNGKSAAQFQFKAAPARFVGLGYRFQGTGSVNFVKLADHSGKIFYEENF